MAAVNGRHLVLVLIILNAFSINCTVNSVENVRYSSLEKPPSASVRASGGSSSAACPCHYEHSIRRLNCSKFDNNDVNDVRCADLGVNFSSVNWLLISGSHLPANFSSLDWLFTNFDNLTKIQFVNNVFDDKNLTVNQVYYGSKLEDLDLSSNNLESISNRLMASFPNLKTININDNNFTMLEDNLFDNNTRLETINMRDNDWWCNELEWLLDWLNGRQVEVLERAEVKCTYREMNTNFGVTTLANLIDKCPTSCRCHMARSMVKVNCRGRGLTSFPRLVPLDTGILHMENNKIDSLRSLINATNYVNLRFVYLDNNTIDSIAILEWTNIFDGLFALHLTGNSLTQVPTHVIDRLFAQSLDQVKLGRNPWNCECTKVSPFHNLMMRNHDRFKDIDNIRCSPDGSYHPGQPIHQLLTSDFCFINTYVNPLDILIVILSFLIVLTMGKVIYDIVGYKRTGKIPAGPFNCINYTGYQPTT